MFVRRILVAVLASSMLWIVPSVASADVDRGGGPDENGDRATPQAAPADTRPSPVVANQDGDFTVLAATYRPFIDDFKYDKLVLEGTAREVCVGGLHTGSAWAFNEIVSRFGGTAGTMYYCRERWDTANNPDCNGQISNPATNPNFYSTCWSNHARGRAIDVMVGRQGGGYNRTRGINIVNWLLASDANGNVNANARKLGIQQILFDDRCWNSDGDRGIATWNQLRPCGIGHHDHVHLDLTLNGAYTNVSYWGATPEVEGKLDTQVLWDRDAGWREAISWFNLSAHGEQGLAVPRQYDEIAVGDLDRDGLEDETFLWDKETGSWAIQNWNDGDSLTATIGTWGRFYDEVYIGDFNVDGYLNDLLLWDRESGYYGVVSWSNYAPYAQSSGWFYPSWDGIYPADLDGNSVVNDMLLFDNQTGQWVAYRWDALKPVARQSGYFPRGSDEIIVGDWSAGGNLDEVILWDRNSGNWRLYSFSGFWPTAQNSGSWNPAVDIAVAGDFDTDGRVDDLFVYVSATGEWTIRSFHRNVMSVRYSTTWGRGYDVISVGSFMN